MPILSPRLACMMLSAQGEAIPKELLHEKLEQSRAVSNAAQRCLSLSVIVIYSHACQCLTKAATSARSEARSVGSGGRTGPAASPASCIIAFITVTS